MLCSKQYPLKVRREEGIEFFACLIFLCRDFITREREKIIHKRAQLRNEKNLSQSKILFFVARNCFNCHAWKWSRKLYIKRFIKLGKQIFTKGLFENDVKIL